MSTEDLIAAVRRHVDGQQRGVLAVLASDLPATSSVVTVPLVVTPDGIRPGMVLSAGLETMSVVSVPGGVTVLRGQDGTRPYPHTSGDTVRVDPAFTDYAIFQALNDDIAAMSSEGLFQVKTLTKRFSPSAISYDLAPDMLTDGIVEIRWQSTATTVGNWPEIRDWTVSTGLPSDVFPSGHALFLGSLGTPGQRFTVVYKAAYAPLWDLDDDPTAQSGIPPSALDIPVLGAAIRLLAGRPVQRSDLYGQGTTRRPAEVTVSDTVNAGTALRVLRQQRVGQERSRLHGQVPTRLVRR